MGISFGPLRTFAAARTPSSARGQVARGTFSGPRSRGTRCGPRRAAPSTPAKLAKDQDTANGACDRTPNHLPWHRSGTPTRGGPPSVAAGRWWCPRAQAPFAVSWLFARLDRDDAAVPLRASVAPRERGPENGGAATALARSRWGAGRARTDGLCWQSQPPALARRLACAQQRSAAKGRPRIPILRLNAKSYGRRSLEFTREFFRQTFKGGPAFVFASEDLVPVLAVFRHAAEISVNRRRAQHRRRFGQYASAESSRLRPRFQHQIERRLRCPAEPRETAFRDDIPQTRLAGLRTQTGTDLLRT